MECSVVKKGPDRAPGGNGCAALAVGILDQDHCTHHDASAEVQVIRQPVA
jgi:hypothetical protein